MKTLLYRRVSTGHQDNSLDVQEALNDEYHRRLDLPAAELFADEDVSGSIPFRERPGGSALLRAIDSARLAGRPVLHVVTSKQDRLGRDTLDLVTTIRLLWAEGITPHFPAEGGALPRTPQNELLFEIKASVAQYERNLIRDRTTAVLRHKAARGELTGTIPYGFDGQYTFADGHVELTAVAFASELCAEPTAPRLSALTAQHGACQSKQLVDNEQEQSWLSQMAAWRGAGLTLKAIAAQLNASGVPSKHGGEWRFTQVARLLESRATARLLGPALNSQPSTLNDPPPLPLPHVECRRLQAA